MERSKDLDKVIRAGAPATVFGRRLFLASVLVPALLVAGWDLVIRTANGDWSRLTFPWETSRPHHADSWGDLVHMSGLPRYQKIFPEGDRNKRVILDSAGFRDRHEEARPVVYTMIGASFFAAGSTNEQTVSGQLEEITGRPVRNLAWPGGGPVRSMQEFLEADASDSGPAPRLVVWGIAQRSLRAAKFAPLHARLTASGDSREPDPKVRIRETSLRYLRWQHQRLQPFLNETSRLRREAGRYARFIPPAAIDPGWTSRVRLGNYLDRPVVFLDAGVESAFQSYDARGGEIVAETIERVAQELERRGVGLLVALIPDKYEVLRHGLEPEIAPRDGQEPAAPVTERFSRELANRGVSVVDLRTSLIVEQERTGVDDPMTYRADDTHWSDRGIRVAAEAISAKLEPPGSASPAPSER